MAKSLTLAIFVTTILAALHQTTVAQPRGPVTYVVGDDFGGWLPSPPGGPGAYGAWAVGKDFFVGDTLVFNFVNGATDVAGVLYDVSGLSEYPSCDTLTTKAASNPLVHLTTSPAKYTLTTEGGTFFTSTYPGQCSSGQILAFLTQGTSIAAPPQADSPTPGGPISSPSSSAPSPAS